jgi:hypothetical protein
MRTLTWFSINPLAIVFLFLQSQIGVQAPLGYYDPLGFLDGADEEKFTWWRNAETKHGRIASK